jgi:lysophospholipase L1-like esterase
MSRPDPNARTGTRRTIGATSAALALAAMLGACASTPTPPAVPVSEGPAPAAIEDVERMLVLGDSISLGVNACGQQGRCGEAAWATGDDAAVASLATRIGVASGRTPDVAAMAGEGARIIDLVDNVPDIVSDAPDLITMLIGSNDACAPAISEMTSVDAFAASAEQLLVPLSEQLPESVILVMSIPDLEQLWRIGHDDSGAVQAWGSSPACRSLLADPQSTAAADEQRRAEVGERVREFNRVLAEACDSLPNCIDDDGAVAGYEFSTDEISSVDHFHPSAAGQQAIAGLAWAALEEGATGLDTASGSTP